jgi:uncharacterized ubiquitin-like protein YukD
MRVIPNDDLPVTTEAQQGPSDPRTASLHDLPISDDHTVRSVSQHAFKTLWIDEPDRRQRWNRIGNMDKVFGRGRPLRTISDGVVKAAIQELREMAMPEDHIKQHLDNFAVLMLWADDWRFIRWGRPSHGGVAPP